MRPVRVPTASRARRVRSPELVADAHQRRHCGAVERAGLSTLTEGQVVEYEEVSNRGKTSAENLKVQR